MADQGRCRLHAHNTQARREEGREGGKPAYDRTLENSCEGWMTKLSELEVHEMRCCILGSSSMLLLQLRGSATRAGKGRGGSGRGQRYLHSLWMKAVWTLGWWTAVAATEGAGMLLSEGCDCD